MFDLMSKARLVGSLFGVLSAVSVVAVVAAQAPPSTKPAARFEVASIRPSSGTGSGRLTAEPGGRFLVTNFPLQIVITSAFDIRPFQLVDVPRWVQVEKFDIVASTGRDEFASVVAMQPLIQTLLAERFRLEVVREQRVMQTYALVRAHPDTLGPQLKPSKADCSSPESRDFANPAACGVRVPNIGMITGIGSPLVRLAGTLIALVDTFVDDDTGLTDAFDFTLKWNPSLTDAAEPDRVSIFTALQEQLGLRLEPRRKAVDVVAIKRIERPTEN